MSPITTHILDTRLGRPAVGIEVTLSRYAGENWWEVARGVSNQDGRVLDLLKPQTLETALYRLVFETGAYFDQQRVDYFYPYVSIDFRVNDVVQHYHVPLLLSPFGYSTYRGS